MDDILPNHERRRLRRSETGGLTPAEQRALSYLTAIGEITTVEPSGPAGDGSTPIAGLEPYSLPSYVRLDEENPEVAPDPHPVTLQIVSTAHGQVSVNGLGRMFPARTVHAKDCSVVVDANHCTLEAKEHYHIRKLIVSLDALTDTSSPAFAAFRALLEHPATGLAAFQNAMGQLAQPHEPHETRAILPIAQSHLTILDGVTGVVQQGDGSHANVTASYVIEEVELPIFELLARNRALVVLLVHAAIASEEGPAARAFVRAVLLAAGHTEDLALLSYCEHLPQSKTSVWDFIGLMTVDSAFAMTIGDHNQIHTDLAIGQGRRIVDNQQAALHRIREYAATIETDSPTEAGATTRMSGLDLLRATQRPAAASEITAVDAAVSPITGLSSL